MANRRDGQETRERILAAARDVFAEKGYRGSTNAEICRRSQVNGAAVNYHFRSKEALYVEAFKRALEESMKSHPTDIKDGTVTPEKRLRALVASTLSRVSDPANKSFEMMRKEMTEPTGLLDGAIHDFIKGERRRMREAVAEIMGKETPESRIELCALSVLSQCVHPALGERGRREGHLPEEFANRPFNPEELANHICQFSLPALKALSGNAAPQARRACVEAPMAVH